MSTTDQAQANVYVLLLFVSGNSTHTPLALENVRRMCETHLADRHQLDVIDVQEDPRAAMVHNIVVTPTLLLLSPPPPVTVVGDMTHTERLLEALRLHPAQGGT
jgi:circadian clock protein KaiB